MARHIPQPKSIADPHWIQVVRIRYRGGDAYDDHDHGFAEAFWIEAGRARHRCNGQESILQPGDLTVLRPEDVHALSTLDEHGFTMVNVVFRRELITDLRARHGDAVQPWPWDGGGQPRCVRLDAIRLERLQNWADDLANDTSRLAAEGFLLELLRRVVQPIDHASRAGLPPWLAHAIERFASGEGMAEGPLAFRRFAGRGADQINRIVREHLAMTATELINELRLEHAARLLRLGQQRVIAVAEACGFASLAHFYRAFTARYGQTPRAFRLSLQAVGRRIEPQAGPRPLATARPLRPRV
jgi:AraC family transcriptional regulator, dual regulator of chb operon